MTRSADPFRDAQGICRLRGPLSPCAESRPPRARFRPEGEAPRTPARAPARRPQQEPTESRRECRVHAKAAARSASGSTTAFRLYEEGPAVNWWAVVRLDLLSRARAFGATLMSLWPPRREDQAKLDVRSRAQVQKGGQAARRKAAPRGANFSLRESMCQIAWARRRAMSIWATFAPRCFPRRRFVRW
jgi:hypothetical protein